MTIFSPFQICVALLVAIAAFTDIRTRRIPNWLTLSGVIAGILVNWTMGGWGGLRMSVAGLVLGFGSYLSLYVLRAMGAGDVKLMAAVGAIIGPANWISVFVASAIAGGVIALFLVIVHRRVKRTMWNVWFIVNELSHFRAPQRKRSDLDFRDARSLNMPHGVAIAAGTAACLFLARI
jgi:prepilin peptidase CpaA